jgi:hypothetical protein
MASKLRSIPEPIRQKLKTVIPEYVLVFVQLADRYQREIASTQALTTHLSVLFDSAKGQIGMTREPFAIKVAGTKYYYLAGRCCRILQKYVDFVILWDKEFRMSIHMEVREALETDNLDLEYLSRICPRLKSVYHELLRLQKRVILPV